MPQTFPCTDSLHHHRLGASSTSINWSCAIIIHIARLWLSLLSDLSGVCTRKAVAKPCVRYHVMHTPYLAAIQTHLLPTGRENSARKKEYTDPLDLVWAHLNQSKDTIPGRNRIRQTRPRICRKSVHASVFFRYQTLNFFIQALILFILSDIMIRDHPYIDFSWGLYCFCLTVTWTLSIVFFTASPCLTKPLSLFLPRGGPV